MKIIPLLMFVLISACGGSKGGGESSIDPVRCLCTPITSITANIDQTLPSNVEVKVNDFTIAHVCNDPDSRAIVRGETLTTIKGNLYSSLMNGNPTKIEIIDLGEDCRNDAILYSNDDVQKEVKLIENRPDRPRREEAILTL